MLINNKGEKQGIISIDEALDAARSASLDLVQVSPSDASPVCVSLWIMENIFLIRKKHYIIKK